MQYYLLYLRDQAEISHTLVDLSGNNLFEHFRLLLVVYRLLSVRKMWYSDIRLFAILLKIAVVKVISIRSKRVLYTTKDR